jgi:hypothetical protein
MSAYTVAFHGVTKNSEAAARSMLRLLLPLLGNHWRVTEATTSDVVLLDAASLEELNRTSAARSSALYIVFEDSGAPPANAFCVLPRPLNSARTIEVLHKAQAELEKRQGGMGATTTLPPAGVGADLSESERGIRTSMRTAVRWVLQDALRAVTLLSARDTKILSALPNRGFTTRLSSSELADLIRKNEPVKLLNLSDEEQQQILGRKRNFEPLIKLEWIFYLAGSNGELRPELSVTKPYRLRKFPDFSRLPHYRADVRMASLLKAEALTVPELAERVGVRLETACNFVNACSALGLLAGARASTPPSGSKNAIPASSPSADEREKPAGLLGTLRNALGLKRKPSEPSSSKT